MFASASPATPAPLAPAMYRNWTWTWGDAELRNDSARVGKPVYGLLALRRDAGFSQIRIRTTNTSVVFMMQCVWPTPFGFSLFRFLFSLFRLRTITVS